MRSTLDNVTAVFAPSCFSHTLLTRNDWQQTRINGVTLPHALEAWEHSAYVSNRIGNPARAMSMLRHQRHQARSTHAPSLSVNSVSGGPTSTNGNTEATSNDLKILVSPPPPLSAMNLNQNQIRDSYLEFSAQNRPVHVLPTQVNTDGTSLEPHQAKPTFTFTTAPAATGNDAPSGSSQYQNQQVEYANNNMLTIPMILRAIDQSSSSLSPAALSMSNDQNIQGQSFLKDVISSIHNQPVLVLNNDMIAPTARPKRQRNKTRKPKNNKNRSKLPNNNFPNSNNTNHNDRGNSNINTNFNSNGIGIATQNQGSSRQNRAANSVDFTTGPQLTTTNRETQNAKINQSNVNRRNYRYNKQHSYHHCTDNHDLSSNKNNACHHWLVDTCNWPQCNLECPSI